MTQDEIMEEVNSQSEDLKKVFQLTEQLIKKNKELKKCLSKVYEQNIKLLKQYGEDNRGYFNESGANNSSGNLGGYNIQKDV